MIENISSVKTVRQIVGVKPEERSDDAETKGIEKARENRDEYVPSEEKEPIGLYSVSSDEDGNLRVSFDSEENNNSKENITTANTDKVDREIKALRDKETALRQKLRFADENTAADIQRELEQVTAELAQKDNDEYRRRNTVFS